ncbi:MAG: PHP domain-containing protein, partial [Sporomusa sp.]
MIRRYVADLHVHSLLSPCAEVEMTPHNIICKAVQNGIDIVAITDHNAADNVAAALEAAKGVGVTVLPGMEVESKEEVHIVVLFENIRQLRAWSDFVELHRTGALNDPEKFGAQ